MSDAWYYVDNGAQAGPVSFAQLRRFLLSTRDGKRTLVWREGLQDWKTAGEMAELAAVFQGPPPIPSRVVPASALVENPRPMDSVSRLTDAAAAPPPKESSTKKVLVVAASIVGALIGIAVVGTFGAPLLWPVALTGIAWFVLAKCKIQTPAIPMVAVLLGHTGWMIVGHIALYLMGKVTYEQLSFLVDVVIVICLAIWFFAARSRASAIGMLVYQICVLIFGVLQMGNVSLPGVSSQSIMVAQAMHIILRIVGIAACVYAVMNLGKKAIDPTQVF